MNASPNISTVVFDDALVFAKTSQKLDASSAFNPNAVKESVTISNYVIVKVFYPLLLMVSHKFSIHLHLQLYLVRCRSLLEIF
nr:MAG TPA: hypothetical protein [Caudoviricetes sp.]